MVLTDARLAEFKEKLGQLKNLLDEGDRMHQDLIQKKTISGESLTSTQLTSIRNRYTDWKSRLQTWYGGLF